MKKFKEIFTNKKKVIIIMSMIILLVFIGVGMFIFMSQKKNNIKDDKKTEEKENKNDNSNINKDNKKCDSDKKIHFFVVFNNTDNSEVNKQEYCINCDLDKTIPKAFTQNPNVTFDGWYYDKDYKEKVEVDDATKLVLVPIKDENDCVTGFEDLNLYTKWKKQEAKHIGSSEELYKELNTLMTGRNYNEYAIRVITSFIPDYQKLFTNDEIYKLFTGVTKVTLNPYDPNNPNLSDTNRAYNAGGNIVINCFKGELDSEYNWDGLRWLLTHEIMHSLGSFQDNYKENNPYNISLYTRNSLLEEGLADSIAHFVKGTEHINKFAVIDEKKFKMYELDSNNEVVLDNEVTHAYTLAGNTISLFKYIGCYNELIHANIDQSWSGLKSCMIKNVKDGEKYWNELFGLLNGMYLYVGYPNQFYDRNQALTLYTGNSKELLNYVGSNTLNKLVISYAKLESEIINNKTDNTYKACDFYKNNLIRYSSDGKTFSSNYGCK